MRLELKHIVGYLPYGLKGYAKHNKEYCKLEGIGRRLGKTVDASFKIGVSNITYTFGLSNFKPILRPFSDLTKEIEHNGERFVPIDWLKSNYTGGGDGQELTFYSDGCYFYSYRKGTHCICRQGEMINKLYEWHFDIHGLIDKGLAISIHETN